MYVLVQYFRIRFHNQKLISMFTNKNFNVEFSQIAPYKRGDNFLKLIFTTFNQYKLLYLIQENWTHTILNLTGEFVTLSFLNWPVLDYET